MMSQTSHNLLWRDAGRASPHWFPCCSAFPRWQSSAIIWAAVTSYSGLVTGQSNSSVLAFSFKL